MLKKTKILVMVLCLGLIPFSVSKAMEKEHTRDKTISENKKRTLTVEDIDFFLDKISEEQEEFKQQWKMFMEIFLESNKEEISKFYIDTLAFLYVECNPTIQYLKSEGYLNLDKLFSVLVQYGKIEPGIEKIDIDRSMILKFERIIKKEISFYEREMQKQVQFFCNKYKKYANQLNEKIDRYIKIMRLYGGDMGVFKKKYYDEAYRDRIYEYIEYLKTSYESFSRTGNSLLKNLRGKKEISNKTLEKFVAAYQVAMSKIFLDKNGNVKLDGFFKKISEQDFLDYGIEKISSDLLSEENKNILKDAFIEYKKLVEKKIEQFCEEHKDYKEALKKKLNKKMSFKDMKCLINENSIRDNEYFESPIGIVYKDTIEYIVKEDGCSVNNIEFGVVDGNSINESSEENFSYIMFDKKINEYVEKIFEYFTKFKNKLEELFNEYSFGKNLSNEALEKFAAIYRLAMSKIFLDENGSVKIGEFLKRLEKLNGERYENKLTEEQKGILKDAFVEYKRLVEEKLEQFYKAYGEESKKRLNKKINKKTIMFDEPIDVLDYLSKNSFPKENYTHLNSKGIYTD